MRKIVLTLIVALGMAGGYAQNETGKFSIKPMAGVNISTFSGGMDGMYHTKAGFVGGVEAEYGVNPWLGLSLGMVYSQQGADIDGSFTLAGIDDQGNPLRIKSTLNGTLKCNYINLPLMANFYIPAVRGLSIKAGIQVGFLTNGKMSADEEIVVVRGTQATSSFATIDAGTSPQTQVTRAQVNMSNVCKSVDVGFPIGLSYEYKNVVLDARYYFGLTKIDKTEDAEDCRNRMLSITLGYRFKL